MVFPLLFAGAARGQSAKTEIDYTGSLLGYYRMEYGEADQNHLPPVKSFLDFRKPDSSRLLLGMGDNFGPEFGASLQLENASTPDPPQGCHLIPNPTDTHETRPESLYKNDDRVAPQADCDNVLNFLMHAGFRAVVPGSQDFMYTARWLRLAAMLLSQADRDPKQVNQIANYDHSVYLLSANLRVAMKGKGGGSGGGGTRCPLLFSQDPLSPNVMRCVGDGTEPEPLDWLSRLDRLGRSTPDQTINPTVSAIQQLATDSAAQAAGRESVLDELAHDEIEIMQSAWGARLSLPSPSQNVATREGRGGNQSFAELAGKGKLTQTTLTQLSAALDRLDLVNTPQYPLDSADRADFITYRDTLKIILANLSKLADPSIPANPSKELLQKTLGDCVQGGNIGSCFVLTPQARIAAANGLLRTIAFEENDIGYTVANTQDGSKVLIVGITGQDTLNAVSHTNLRMCAGAERNAIDAFGPCGARTDVSSFGSAPTVVAGDPVAITEAIVRSAELQAADRKERPFDKVVVMAQMPHTEAEVLAERVWKLLSLDGVEHPVDVVLGEAELGYSTPQVTVSYPASANGTYPAPVVAPIPSYSSETGNYPGKVSRLTLVSAADQSFSMSNQPDGIFDPPSVKGSLTTISLLSRLIAELQHASPSQPIVGTDLTSKQKAEFALLQDLQKSRHPKADVVLLQSRDVELDAIGPAYAGYEVCAGETGSLDLCKLRVALDRIFWKGDFLEYVAVTGKSLKSILAASQQKMAQQAQLADTGFTQEWLISYGIVQSALSNVTEINQNNEPLWIPVDPSCTGDTPGQSTYCVGGTPISDDAYYWLVTSDQLAEDKAVYGTLQSLPSVNHQRTELYVTAPLAHFLLDSLHGGAAQVAALGPPTGSPEKIITAENQRFQQAPVWQIDFAKMIASFASRAPVGGNTFVETNFSAVSDSRASAPTQQEMDLELANRITGAFLVPGLSGKAPTPIWVGEQTSFAYDRSVIGNLTGRPINPSYSLNNLTEGAFLQVRLHSRSDQGTVRGVRSLPRSLLVFTPYQYQLQINTPYLFFPFAGGASGELTVPLPRVSAWNDRAGFRHEFSGNSPKPLFSTGSYFETGLEFSTQNNVLASLTLQDKTTGTSKTCQVSAYVSLQTCFTQAKFVINTNNLNVFPGVKTLHALGFYWDLHLQHHLFGKGQGKQISLVTDSQGDYYFGRPPSAELPTQTEYAIPLSVSFVLPVFGNLSFAPTYSGFFYQPQRSNESLQVNSFSIAARWYFARDARVPFRRQIPLSGPASADQTHTGKGH